MTADRKRFIKSATTSTPVGNSKAELERLLTRYGCKSFAVQHDYAANLSTVTFVVPDSLEKGAADIPIQLDVNARAVYDAMFGQPTRWTSNGRVFDPKLYREKELAQAERVAWRQVLLWVDAALSAAAAGVQPISEAFFAQTLIRDPKTGGMTRIVDQVNQLAPGGSWKALLPSRAGA
ncbi:MAG TPA: hypothetical protein PK308_00285 [Phycisphaerales bacterium]|nr:hypothetical protein [Phycisphaerales bacterium]